jgi:lambda family phage tail tape measure protein
MSIATEIRLRIKAEGEGVLKGLSGKLQDIANGTQVSSEKFKLLSTALKDIQSATAKSTNSIKDYSAAWRLLAGSVDASSAEFKEATKEANQLDAKLKSFQGSQTAVANNFRNIASAAKQASVEIAAAARVTSTGLRMNPLTGGYTGIAGQTQYAQPIGPVLPPRDLEALETQQIRSASQEEARDARRRQKLQDRAAYEGLPGVTLADRSKLKDYQQKFDPEPLKRSFGAATTELKKLEATTTRSTANLRSYSTSWRELAGSVDITSKQFKTATAESARLDAQIAKAEGTNRKTGSRLKTGAQVAGTAVAAGIFGGPEAAIGAVAGGIAGGVPGAQIGATAGAVVSALRRQAAAVATNVAEINKYRIALAGVSTNQKDYNVSIKDVTSLSRAYLLPLKDATQQYTQLKASIVGAGGSTEQTTKVFRGIAAAIVGTGGNAESLNAALRATAQVFSKGKVSAEELRQQIGERLPGAFSIFAQAIGKTPQQLDKALEDGKVTLADFLKFSDELYKRYGETAQTLADAPENAGQRLKVALDFATIAFGGFFQTVGAGFQSYFRGLTEFVLQNETTIKRVITILAVGFSEIGKLIGSFAKFFVDVFNAAFTLILGNLETVLSRVEEAINRAKAVQTLTPEKITQAQQQASIATADKFGVRVGGFNTRIIIDTQGAEKEYNTTFNSLIDSATKAAGATNYTKKFQSILFPEFTPDKFGAGVGNVQGLGTDPGGADGGGKKKGGGGSAAANALAASKERTEVLKKEANTLFDMALMQDKIYDLGQKGGKQAILDLTFEKDRLKILGEYDVKATKVDNTANKSAELKALQNKRNVELVALQLKFEEQTREVIREQNQLRTTAKQQIEDVLIASGAIPKEEAAKIQLDRTVANFKEQFKTLVDVDALSEQLRKALEQAAIDAKDFGKQFGKAFQDGIKSMGDLAGNLGSSFASAFEGMADQLTEFVTTGKMKFRDFAASVLKDISRMIIRYAMFQAMQGIFSSIGGSSTKET